MSSCQGHGGVSSADAVSPSSTLWWRPRQGAAQIGELLAA